MTQKSLSKLMKLIIILLGVCGAVLYSLLLPIGNGFASDYPEFSYCFAPWLIFLLLTLVPCYSVLILGWKIASSIAQDNSFTEINSKRLKSVAVLALATSVYLFLGDIVFFLFGMNHPSTFIALLFIVFIGIAITVASAVLSYLVKKAAALQEQSDLTI